MQGYQLLGDDSLKVVEITAIGGEVIAKANLASQTANVGISLVKSFNTVKGMYLDTRDNFIANINSGMNVEDAHNRATNTALGQQLAWDTQINLGKLLLKQLSKVLLKLCQLRELLFLKQVKIL